MTLPLGIELQQPHAGHQQSECDKDGEKRLPRRHQRLTPTAYASAGSIAHQSSKSITLAQRGSRSVIASPYTGQSAGKS